MRATAGYKAQTYREVNVSGIADDRPVSDDFIAGFAMASVGEEPSSLFGWAVDRIPLTTAATVTLYTD